jgi:hypothetical protein
VWRLNRRLCVLLVAGMCYVDILGCFLYSLATLWVGKRHTHAHSELGKGEAVWTMKQLTVSRPRKRYYRTQLKRNC